MEYFQLELLRLFELLLCFILLLRGWTHAFTTVALALTFLDFLISHPEVLYFLPSLTLNFVGLTAQVLWYYLWETTLGRYCPHILSCINRTDSSPERKLIIYLLFTLTFLVILLERLINTCRSRVHSRPTRFWPQITEVTNHFRAFVPGNVNLTVCPARRESGIEDMELWRKRSFNDIDDDTQMHMRESGLSSTILASNGFFYSDNNIVMCCRCQEHLRRRHECQDPLRDSHRERCYYHPKNQRSDNYRESFACDRDLPLHRPTSFGSASSVQETSVRPAAVVTDQPISNDTTGSSSTSARPPVTVAPQPAAATNDDGNQAVGGALLDDIDVNIPILSTKPQQPEALPEDPALKTTRLKRDSATQ